MIKELEVITVENGFILRESSTASSNYQAIGQAWVFDDAVEMGKFITEWGKNYLDGKASGKLSGKKQS